MRDLYWQSDAWLEYVDLQKDKILFSQGKKEFLHVHGIHRVAVNFSDRESIFFSIHSCTEQTSGCDDMVFWCFLAGVLQRSHSTLTKLDLVKSDERIPSGNRLSADMGQDRKQIRRADVFIKGGCQCFACLKVEVSHIVVILPSELQDGIGLSNLTRSLDDQGLSVFTVFPLFQIFRDLSVHIHVDSSVLGILCRYIISRMRKQCNTKYKNSTKF